MVSEPNGPSEIKPARVTPERAAGGSAEQVGAPDDPQLPPRDSRSLRGLRPRPSLGPELADWGLSRASFAASGGAVAAVCLGLWSGLTLWWTGWTVINASLGLALGIWGLQSRRTRTALVGIALNAAAFLAAAVSWR